MTGPVPSLPRSELAKLAAHMSSTEIAAIARTTRQNVESRLKRLGVRARPVGAESGIAAPSVLTAAIPSGVALVGGDAHYWPGPASTAHRAFVKFAKDLKPKIVVMNGDAIDGSTISAHPPIGWENLPTMAEELAAVQERLGEIRSAAKGARLVWPLGNHDARFNRRLATLVPEFKGVGGTRLVHHFPEWEPCWALEIGGAIVKHRYKGGSHAPYNNALASGRTMITGHLHSQKVSPYSDYNGTRYGVDTGCLSPTTGPQYNYNEDNPRDWRSGFAVLTWWRGTLLMPELVTVMNEAKGLVQFRGSVINV